MKLKYHFIFLLLIPSFFCIAQKKLGYAWVQGSVNMVRVTKFNDTSISKQYKIGTPPTFTPNFDNGKSNICDTNGNLLILCNGHNIYDTNLNYLDNGDSITFEAQYTHDFNGGYCAQEQWSLILPFSNNQYRVINLAVSDSMFASQNTTWFFPPDYLLYSDVDMNANGGAGKVVRKRQVIDKGRFAFNGMQACRHANGHDWWLVKQCFDSLAFYTFLLTDTGITKMGMQSFPGLPPIYAASEGQIMFNNKGNKMISINKCPPNSNYLFLLDFNRCTGVLSNVNAIPGFVTYTNFYGFDSSTVGACFSPNDSFVYVAKGSGIIQYNIYPKSTDSTWIKIIDLDTSYNAFASYGNIFPGPDGKIYISNWDFTSGQMSVINKPNKKGLAAEFCPRCLRFDTILPYYASIGGPPNMPNYAMGADSTSCWPLSNVQLAINKEQLKVYPNPAFSNVIIDVGELTKNNICIINTAGQVLYNQLPKTTKTTIDVSQWTSGVYFVRYGSAVKRLVVE